MSWVGRFWIVMLSGIFGALVLVLGPVEESAGYVMPPEQVLDYMAKYVLGFETLGVVLEFTREEDEGGEEGPVTKRVWFRPPDRIHVRAGDEGGDVFPWLEPGVLSLFSGNQRETERFLARSGVGLGLHDSSYDRVEGTVAYRIGSSVGDGPILWVEKQRFLPLLLVFEPPGARVGETARVRFKDYRKIGDGWFPYEIVCRAASGVTRAYTVRDLSVNAPVQDWISAPSERKEPERDQGDRESGRLERVLRTFEEKYGTSTP